MMMFLIHKKERGIPVRALYLFFFFTLVSCCHSGQKPPLFGVGAKTVAVLPEMYQAIRYVSATTDSDQDGDGSKVRPWGQIQAALAQITDASPTRRYAILVSQGAYSLDTIVMKPYIDLYGGFEPDQWRRDIFQSRSLLSGSGKRRVLIGTDHARLDGFVIGDGHVTGKGAGIYVTHASPVITNNIFRQNVTQAPVPWQPAYRHEIANDGGAIYCENQAAPVIENNIFIANATKAGRGAAIAFHKNCQGRIANNVFMENKTGLDDPMRSSDGGAVSIFDWCNPIIENNLFLNNAALSENDAGALFVALWSSPVIRKNIFVGNTCDDDGGALFVGGQEHRYERPLDELPDSSRFFVTIDSNIFIGNSNKLRNSGALRFTMESRGAFRDNIVAYNSSIYFQRCEVTIQNNLILDDFTLIETKAGLRPSLIQNNLIWGNFNIGALATVIDNHLKQDDVGAHQTVTDFTDRRMEIQVSAASFQPGGFFTRLLVANSQILASGLVNRIVKAGNQWGVIKASAQSELEVWGDFSGMLDFVILPNYRSLLADSVKE